MYGPSTNGAAKRRRQKLPDGVDLRRLCDAMARDRRDLEPFRKVRREIVRQHAGFHYGDNAAAAEVPVNLIGLYVDVIAGALVDNNPRLMYSTFDAQQTATVDALQAWANDELEAMNAAEALRRAVTDALFCVGVLKVGLATPADAAAEAWDVHAGQPFLEALDLDDCGWDMTARTFDRCAYVFHRYRLPVDLANELYLRGKADKLEPAERADYNQSGDERIHTLTATRGYRDEMEDHCDLWEVEVRRHKVVLVLRDDNGIPDWGKGPVDVHPLVAHPRGHYCFLGFGTVPGNLMPKAPVTDLIDLHRAYNAAYRKLIRQTRDKKKNLVYDGQQTEFAKLLRDAPDGAMIEGRPDSVAEVESGGPANDVLVMSDHFKSMYEFVGGNISLLGGRAPQARTASQDKMLNENAGSGVATKQAAALAFVADAAERLTWLWWHHPTKEMTSSWASPALPDYRLTRAVRPADRRGPLPRLKIDPYSLPRQSPQSRVAYIQQVWQTISPALMLLAQQGKLPDMDALLKLFAKYGDEPDLATIFNLSFVPDPGHGSPGGDGGGPGMPAQTTRTYERYSHGGEGPQQEAADLTADISRMEGPVNPNQGS